MTVGGVVLAAGAGRRFGGPKQLAELDGVPLLQHAVDAVGDQPRITAQVIAAVVTEAARARAECAAVRASYDGQPGHPVALGRSLLPAVAGLRGDVGARDLLDAAATRAVEVGHLCRPDDVDVPADLEALRASVGGRRDAR